MIFAQQNGRKSIGAPDKLFGVSQKAKERIAEIGKENVINSTIGVLLGDDGKLTVLDSVTQCIRRLSPEDYAAYAPILGTPQYIEAVKKAVFLDEMPQAFVEACYTPGGTGAIRNAVSAYTKPGEKVLTSDWHWSPYKIIAGEIGREITTYRLFDNHDKFNRKSFEQSLTELTKSQDQVLVIVNTPAHNPTGYTFTSEDWDNLISVVKTFEDKRIVVLVDIAYLDFAGDPKEYRSFFKKLENPPANMLPLIAFSASKGYTMYGMRLGALLCMAPDETIAKEFKDVMSVECRGSWSNGNRAAMTVLADIMEDEKLFGSVVEERNRHMEILKKRGAAFMEEASREGLKVCPYDSGFFVTIPCENAEEVSAQLQKNNVFAITLGPGIRVSVASNTEKECRAMPSAIKKAMAECGL